ncbi:nuclear egress membrane protein [Equid alphaherpesvirus 4]|uniref:26 n=2 Tax=Equid alphaherpesvirus 4 TaxID=10331 RepID=A0A288CG22_EHV4|nr:nuclear egress membrane protein [Equid alphaherpesvirus 4]AAC59541.1 26 [Equid alphaherpesvirus 4]AMB15910.1 nuclear egress membrane protein [Equid alphaherpesvirus 4]AMB15989.1 nuclear egress membrane protein [Equid alphaherpesvirus 4]AMB16068.1 nuclear egress membrane protein [Equid alphaherpesvirus 4]AMB16147.1 nuclear egress membrane protein [Equid alphaherpesvirus 4]
MKAYDYRDFAVGGSLLQRIRLVVSGSLHCGESDATLNDPKHLPARCVFQFSGPDNNSVTFPIEYVLRLMKNWARSQCDPYIRIQNTGVSVLFQGFFFAPPNAPMASITSEHNNVILKSTHTTGLSLSGIERVKRGGGLDLRPLQAMMQISCFTRMPVVQLSFRFMGPEDASRTQRLLERATSFGAIEMQRKRTVDLCDHNSLAASREQRECRERQKRRPTPKRCASEVFASLTSISNAFASERVKRRPGRIAAVIFACAFVAVILAIATKGCLF